MHKIIISLNSHNSSSDTIKSSSREEKSSGYNLFCRICFTCNYRYSGNSYRTILKGIFITFNIQDISDSNKIYLYHAMHDQIITL